MKRDIRQFATASGVELLVETGVIAGAMPEAVVAAYRAALSVESISLTDAFMIRDLLELSGLAAAPDPALHRLLIALCAARNRGSLCLRLDEKFLRQALDKCCSHALGSGEAADLLCRLEAGGWAPLVARDESAGAPLIYVPSGPYLYFQRYFLHERRLQEALVRLARREDLAGALSPVEVRNLALEASRYEHFRAGGRLTAEQLRAVYLALRNPFTIISGGPGTGKTTLATSILRGLVRAGTPVERIRLVAPTGRAGRRMGEAVQASLTLAGSAVAPEIRAALEGISGSTIHRLLRFNPSRGEYTYGPYNPLPLEVLICDEVSMVDVVLMERLLAALPAATRVIFLGDRDQLPSVDAGAVLGDLIPRQVAPLYSAAMRAELEALDSAAADLPVAERVSLLTDRIVLLTRSHRARGPVMRAAAAFNRGDDDAIAGLRTMRPRPVPFIGTGGDEALRQGVLGLDWGAFQAACIRIEPGNRPIDRLRQVLLSWTDWLFRGEEGRPSLFELLAAGIAEATLAAAEVPAASISPELFECFRRGRILTITRRGPFGCENINRFLAGFWGDRLDARRPSGAEMFAGSPIVITRNDYRRNLFNGDVGLLVRAADTGRCYGVFQQGDRLAAFPVEMLPDFDLAFAMTVHKSQGSEYGNVLLVAPDAVDHPLLTREIVYTGITRTRGSAFLFATEEALRAAAGRRIERYSGIELWQPDE